MYHTIFWRYQECKLIFASNGLEAMNQLVLQNDIDLIISDINMPKMDGLVFLKTMSSEGYSHIPVIVISTEGKEDDIRRALELGARAYIKKPWAPKNVWEIIDRIIN